MATEDILGLISRDEEEAIHEDELILLDDIISRSSGVNHETLRDILALTFLNDEDYGLIQTSLQQSDLRPLITSHEISPILRAILQSLQKNKGIPHKVYIQQHTTMTDGNRYRWRGRMNTASQEIGALSVRNRHGLDILDQYSFYVLHQTKNRRWLVGDHQMAFGFGLVSGKSFPARKGWSTVNTGASLYHNGLSGYKSSTGVNRRRGIAVEQNTKWGTVSISHGQTGADADGRSGFSSGAWRYENKSLLVGTALTRVAQSVFAAYELGHIRAGGELSFGSGKPSMVVGFKYGIRPFKYVIQFRDIHANSTGEMANPMVEWRGSEISERGLFQGAFIRTGKTRVMIYADAFHHHMRDIDGYEFGIRSESKMDRHRIVFQVKTEKKDHKREIVYAPLISPAFTNKNGIKLEHRYGTKTWRTDMKYQFVRAGDTEFSNSHGLDLRLHLFRKHTKIELDWMAARVGSFDSRIYFWDLNLPGAMMSRMMARSYHSQGAKVLFNLSNGARLGIKIRADFAHLSWRSEIEISGGIFIQAAL